MHYTMLLWEVTYAYHYFPVFNQRNTDDCHIYGNIVAHCALIYLLPKEGELSCDNISFITNFVVSLLFILFF